MNLGRMSSIALLAVGLSGRLHGQSPQVIRLDAVEALELHHLKTDVVTYRGRTAVRIANTGVLDSGYGEGLAIVRGYRSATAQLKRPFLAIPCRMLLRNFAVSLGSRFG
jgi:hypothetical protein